MEDSRVKIVFCGDTQVGKTSIFAVLTDRGFPQQSVTTIGAGHETVELKSDSGSFCANLWDTAGQEVYRSLLPTYFRNANYCILTFDVTNQNSFFNLNDWVAFIKDNAPSDIRILLVGNKMDLESMIVVSISDATDYANTIDAIGFVAVSAKTNYGIEEMVGLLIEDNKKLPANKRQSGPIEKEKKGCC